jgi:integrase
MKERLTKSSVEAIEPAPRDVYAWDDQLPGFGVKVTPAGARIYILKYRHRGAQRWLTLGRHGEVTVAAARQKALRERGRVADGEDPAAARAAKTAAPTVDDLANRYLLEHAESHKKPRSAEEDRRNLRLHVRPALGAVRVADVTRQDILKLHHAMRETPGAANRVVALASMMFGLAQEWGMRPEGSNPCRRIKKFKERARDRFLTGDELRRMGEALLDAEGTGEHPTAIAIIRLLVLTGCRLSEITTLQWEFVDIERSCLRLADSKTGAKVVRLGAPALDLLANLPRLAATPYVFPAARRGRGPGHFVGVNHIWLRIRAKAGLHDVRLHDLRHTFASWSVMGGTTLHVTGALLGHRQPQTTARYAHLAEDPVQAAADRVAAAIAGNMVVRRPAGLANNG